MTSYFDALETRSVDERAAALGAALPEQIARAKGLTGYAERLADVDASTITDRDSLAALPVLRKADLGAAQADAPPFGCCHDPTMKSARPSPSTSPASEIEVPKPARGVSPVSVSTRSPVLPE